MDHQLNERHDKTRHTLHRIANHVLARAEHAANAHVGLRATPGGFSTTTIRADRERIRVSGEALVRESVTPSGTWTRSIAIDGSTLGELAAFADVDPGAEFSAGHDTPPVGDIDEPFEHFDAALDMAFDPETPADGRVNMGGSPGDGFHAAPYLYVGPWTPDRPGDPGFWNAPFGAVVGYHDVAAAKDPVEAAHAFLRTGLERLTA